MSERTFYYTLKKLRTLDLVGEDGISEIGDLVVKLDKQSILME